MTVDGDVIADCVLKQFDSLPSKAKPRIYPNGSQEWVPLSGIVLSKGLLPPAGFGNCNSNAVGKDRDLLYCVSLGTGMRCLPACKIPFAKGQCLHDWHAEVVAIRAFNLFLLQECSRIVSSGATTSDVIRKRSDEEISPSSIQPFAIKDEIRIHMYCSDAPCGDGSMELVMNSQNNATPWQIRPLGGEGSRLLNGRGYFSELGHVRRKPARGDAPETLSKSCSDKLSMKQCTSLLSSVLSLLIHPGNAYLHDLILPRSQHDTAATHRAFAPGGRMASLVGTDGASKSWSSGYAFRPFSVRTTTREFSFSRNRAAEIDKVTGSNITAMWTPTKQEVLIGGTVQGFKQFSQRGSSAICKASIWKVALAISQALAVPALVETFKQPSHRDIKASRHLEVRATVKKDVCTAALCNWVRNNGDEVFGIDGAGSPMEAGPTERCVATS